MSMSNTWLNSGSRKGVNTSTFVMIKPRGLTHWPLIKKRIEATAPISRTRLVFVTRELIEQHYAEHAELEFFTQLTDYFVGKYVLALEVLAAPEVIREIIGSTNPQDSGNENTIRGLVNSLTPDDTTPVAYTKGIDNLIHAANKSKVWNMSAEEMAKREIELWFGHPVPPTPDYLCLMNRKVKLEGDCVSPLVGIDFDLSDAKALAGHITDLLEALPWNQRWSEARQKVPALLVGGIPALQIIAVQYLTTLTGRSFEICWIDQTDGMPKSVGLPSVKERARRHRDNL